MNASEIVNDSMSLEEKLKAIDEAMKVAAIEMNISRGLPANAPIDPADLTMCEGCQ